MEDNKEPIKIKLSTAILILVLVLMLIFGIGILVYNKTKTDNTNITNQNEANQISQNETNENVENRNTETENNKETKKISYDTNDNQIEMIYDYIPRIDINKIETNAYQKSAIKLKDLDEKYILKVAFEKIGVENIEEEAIENQADSFSFNASVLQNKIKEMFGKNANVKNQSFDIGYGGQPYCEYKDGKYYYSYAGGSPEFIQNISKIVEAYKEGDNIYIVDKYALLTSEDEGHNYKLYADSNLNNIIEEFNETIDQTTGEGINELTLDKDIDQVTDYIINNYETKMKKYKHTFKKNEDGTYYWYSTEPM